MIKDVAPLRCNELTKDLTDEELARFGVLCSPYSVVEDGVLFSEGLALEGDFRVGDASQGGGRAAGDLAGVLAVDVLAAGQEVGQRLPLHGV